MGFPEIRLIGLTAIPEIAQGDDLAAVIGRAARASNVEILGGDIFVVAQKIVSKAQGRTVRLSSVEPSALALSWASEFDKDPRMVEVVLRESRRVVRMERGIIISETRHGFVCANAGVDASNVAAGHVTVLPKDPDASAAALRDALASMFDRRIAVVVSDTF